MHRSRGSAVVTISVCACIAVWWAKFADSWQHRARPWVDASWQTAATLEVHCLSFVISTLSSTVGWYTAVYTMKFLMQCSRLFWTVVFATLFVSTLRFTYFRPTVFVDNRTVLGFHSSDTRETRNVLVYRVYMGYFWFKFANFRLRIFSDCYLYTWSTVALFSYMFC